MLVDVVLVVVLVESVLSNDNGRIAMIKTGLCTGAPVWVAAMFWHCGLPKHAYSHVSCSCLCRCHHLNINCY